MACRSSGASCRCFSHHLSQEIGPSRRSPHVLAIRQLIPIEEVVPSKPAQAPQPSHLPRKAMETFTMEPRTRENHSKWYFLSKSKMKCSQNSSFSLVSREVHEAASPARQPPGPLDAAGCVVPAQEPRCSNPASQPAVRPVLDPKSSTCLYILQRRIICTGII